MSEKRDKVINVRVTEKEKKQLRRKAKICNLSLSEYLRKRGIDAPVQAFPLSDFYSIYQAVNDLMEGIYSEDRDYLEWGLSKISALLYTLYTKELEDNMYGNNEDLGN